MDCIDLFKKAAAALQTDPRYLELDAARRENDMDEELQNMIGEFNLARLDLNNESAKAETDAARVAELNQRVNDLYSQIMASEGMVRYNAAKAECEAMVSHIDAIINTAMNGGDPMTVQLLHLRRLPLKLEARGREAVGAHSICARSTVRSRIPSGRIWNPPLQEQHTNKNQQECETWPSKQYRP